MKANDFIEKLELALNSQTVYALGGIGQPTTPKAVEKLKQRYPINKQFLAKVTDKKRFAFDCSGLIKSILWGWRADVTKAYGGAKYKSTIPDCNADTMFRDYCYNHSMDFSNIEAGELVWKEGHIGVYVGKGSVIECTRSFTSNVLMTFLGNSNPVKLSPSRVWTAHAKCKYVEYNSIDIPTELVYDVIEGKYGVYPERKKRIEDKGYNYYKVQELVNKELEGRRKNDKK